MRAVAAELQGCCESLAAVLRDNAPVGLALEQLQRMELAFVDLQQAVGAQAASAAVGEADAADAEAPPQVATAVAMEQLIGTGDDGKWEGVAAAAAGAFGSAAGAGGNVARDGLALHLTLSCLFTCCSKASLVDSAALCCTPGVNCVQASPPPACYELPAASAAAAGAQHVPAAAPGPCQ